jgi:putative oxidoreductase
MTSVLRRWSPLPLRLLVGIGFIGHAAPRLFTVAGHLGFAAQLRQFGVPYPETAAWLASLSELLGGLAVLEGLVFPVATLLLLADVVASLVAAHLHDVFSVVAVTRVVAPGPQLGMPGAQVDLFYVAALVSLLLSGPGPLSVAEAVGRRRPSPAASPPRRGEPVPPLEAHARA